MKRIKMAVVMLLAVAMMAMAVSGNVLAAPQSLIILGLDGVGRDTFERLSSEGKIPNMTGLASAYGFFKSELVTASLTIPSWATVFTGMTDLQHGCFGNANKKIVSFNREALIRYSGGLDRFSEIRWWSRVIPFEQTMFSGMSSEGIKLGWLVSKRFLGDDPEKSPFTEVAAKAATYKYYDPDPKVNKGSYDYLDMLAQEALAFLERQKVRDGQFVLFVHTNPDYFGHHYGERGERYEEEVVRVDDLLGRLLVAKNEDTQILVITDHGFDADSTHHKNADMVWLITTIPLDPKYLKGGITHRDITPTIREWLGRLEWKKYSRGGKVVLAGYDGE